MFRKLIGVAIASGRPGRPFPERGAGHIGVKARHPAKVAHPEQDMIDVPDRDHAASAFTPGSSLPSIHSRKAPPAVETKVNSSATPA